MERTRVGREWGGDVRVRWRFSTYWPSDMLYRRVYWGKEAYMLYAAYQRSLASALDAIDTYEERRWFLALIFMVFAVFVNSLEYERDAVFGPVVADVRHDDSHMKRKCQVCYCLWNTFM